MTQPVSERIRKALHQQLGWSVGEANAAQIYKGWSYGSSVEAFAWWVVPFGETPIYFGQSWTEAQGIIDESVACKAR